MQGLIYCLRLRGVTQAELAVMAGMAPSAISHFATGTRKPSYDNLIRLAAALEVSVDQIMGRPEGLPRRSNLGELGEIVQCLSFDDMALLKGIATMLRDRAERSKVGV